MQQYKHKRNHILPPIQSLNQALTLALDAEVLFPCANILSGKSTANWFYTKTNKIDTDYIANVVKNWLNLSFKKVDCLTKNDIQTIQSLSGSDLQFYKVQLPDPIWTIKDGELIIDPLCYSLIPYLVAKAIVASPLPLMAPSDNKVFEEMRFYECIVEQSSAQELISWPPRIITKNRKKKDSEGKEDSEEEEEIAHYYSFLLKFSLQYNADGEPYLNCDYGVRRWVNWELRYLSSGKTVYIKPKNSQRFAPCKLKYMGEERGVDFEGNLVNLLNILNRKEKFTATEVLQTPYKNDDLAWGVVYGNTISRSHNAEDGLFPIDNEIFHKACLERIQNELGQGFSFVEPYLRCDSEKIHKVPRKAYNNDVKNFIKAHFASVNVAPPFYIPPNLRIVLLAQSKDAEKLIYPLAKKYRIDDVTVIGLGENGAELSGKNWKKDCENRIKRIEKTLPKSPPDKITLTLIEILPKKDFWGNARVDPKPCFRPALAKLDSVTDHFEPKDEKDIADVFNLEELNLESNITPVNTKAKSTKNKLPKNKLPKSEFAHRMESSLKSGLSMAGAYIYPTCEAENFPTDAASVGVYKIPFYIGEITKYLLVAVRMDKTSITAKAYGSDDWLDFHLFQIKMASGAFTPMEYNKKKVQDWVFNTLFKETTSPTIYCFDAANLRHQGLPFLQKKYWRRHQIAFDISDDPKSENIIFLPADKYPHVRIASIITPSTAEVPIYRACDLEGNLEGHTAGVFYPSSKTPECGHYFLSNQRPESRSGGILSESKLISPIITRGEKLGQLKKPKPYAQGYNPRGIFLNLTLQESDCFQDWATFVQCLRLYVLIQYLDATNYPAPLHQAAGLDDYRPIQAIREP